MKKNLLAILMCLVMVFCSVAYAESTAPDLTGEWVLDSIEAMGMSMKPSMMGLTMTMTVNADGTVVLDSNGEKEEATWTQEGDKLIVEEDAFTYVDGKLTATEESMGATMYFVRSGEEEEILLPEAIADPELADFNGTWNLTVVSAMGMDLPAAMMGVGMGLEILDGAVVVSVSEMNEEGNMETVTAPEAVAAEFADGALNLAVPAMEMVLKLQLRNDGKLFFEQVEDGMSVHFVFEKVVAE